MVINLYKLSNRKFFVSSMKTLIKILHQKERHLKSQLETALLDWVVT